MGLHLYMDPSIEGALTASGETYRRTEYTAAHPTLPFQSIVRVTRLDRKNSVVVRINDRGPFALGRIIELSEAAADDLGVAKKRIGGGPNSPHAR